MEVTWAKLKGGYGRRYEPTGVKGYGEAFFTGFPQSGIPGEVSHFGRTSESVLEDGPHIPHAGDLAPLEEDSDRSGADEDLGDMMTFRSGCRR